MNHYHARVECGFPDHKLTQQELCVEEWGAELCCAVMLTPTNT